MMNDLELTRTPQAFDAIARDTEAFGFTMVSEPKVGAFLAALAASKPGGRLLELRTGTGHGTAGSCLEWMRHRDWIPWTPTRASSRSPGVISTAMRE